MTKHSDQEQAHVQMNSKRGDKGQKKKNKKDQR